MPQPASLNQTLSTSSGRSLSSAGGDHAYMYTVCHYTTLARTSENTDQDVVYTHARRQPKAKVDGKPEAGWCFPSHCLSSDTSPSPPPRFARALRCAGLPVAHGQGGEGFRRRRAEHAASTAEHNRFGQPRAIYAAERTRRPGDSNYHV